MNFVIIEHFVYMCGVCTEIVFFIHAGVLKT